MVQSPRDIEHPLQHGGVEHQVPVALAHPGAGRHNLLDRTLANQLVVVVPLGHHDRHATALEIEGNLVDLFVVLGQLKLFMDFDMLQHSAVQQVLQAGLIEAVEVGKFQHQL